MAQKVDTNAKGFICDEADNAAGSVLQFIRCKMDADGRVTIAGATDMDLGVNLAVVFKQGDPITLDLNTKAGTQKVVASGAVTAGQKVYTAANGKVSTTQATGAFLRGIALQNASGNNSEFEIMPMIGEVAGA